MDEAVLSYFVRPCYARRDHRLGQLWLGLATRLRVFRLLEVIPIGRGSVDGMLGRSDVRHGSQVHRAKPFERRGAQASEFGRRLPLPSEVIQAISLAETPRSARTRSYRPPWIRELRSEIWISSGAADPY